MKTSLKVKLTSLTLGLTMALGGLVGLGAEAAKETKAAIGDEITSIDKIQDGATYYIKGIRTVNKVSKTFYLTFSDSEGSQKGTESETKEGAVALAFNLTNTANTYNLVTPSGLYASPNSSNGTIKVSANGVGVTASNNGSKIRLSTTISNTVWSIQKNSTAANFGGYKNTQTDITLILAAEPAATNPVVTGVSLDQTSLTKTVGDADVTLNATVSGTDLGDNDKGVTWSVINDNPAGCVSVSNNGVVSFNSAGTATVKATSTKDTTKSATCSVTVSASITPYIELSSSKTSYFTGDPFSITINSGYLTGSLNVSAPVGTHSGNTISGTFTTAGQFVFTATDSGSGTTDSITLTVQQSQVNSIVLDKHELELSIGGQSQKLNATVDHQGNVSNAVTWMSSKPEIATVDNDGNVTPLAKGSTTITASCEGGKSDTCQVTVSNTQSLILHYTGSATSNLSVDNVNCVGSYGLSSSEWNITTETIKEMGTSNNVGINQDGTTRLYYSNSSSTVYYNNFKLKCLIDGAIIKTIKFIFTGTSNKDSTKTVTIADTNKNAYVANSTGEVVGTDYVYPINDSEFMISSRNGAIHFYSLEINYLIPSLESYSIKTPGTSTFATNEKFNARGLVLTGKYDVGDPKELSYASESGKFKFYSDAAYTQSVTPGITVVNDLSRIYVVYDNFILQTPVSYPITHSNHSLTISGQDSVLAEATLQLSADDNGSISGDTKTWSITDGTAYASIDSSTGLLTAGTVTSDQQVTVKVECLYGGTATKVIRIKKHTLTINAPATAVYSKTVNCSVASHDGSDTVSWNVVSPNKTVTTSSSFTANEIGTYTVTATCTCGGTDTKEVVVSYNPITEVTIYQGGVETSSMSVIKDELIEGFTAVCYDQSGESLTVDQTIVWSVESTLDESLVQFNQTNKSLKVLDAGTVTIKATSVNGVVGQCVVSVASVSAEIGIDESAREVFQYAADAQIHAIQTNFINPVYSWTTEDADKVTFSSTSTEYTNLVYVAPTGENGVNITLTISERDNASITASQTINIVVKSSTLDTFEIICDNRDVSGSSIDLYDNGEEAMLEYHIEKTGNVGETASWSLKIAEGYSGNVSDYVIFEEAGEMVSITTKDKISNDVNLVLTATSDDGNFSTVSRSVTIMVLKTTVDVARGTETYSVFNGDDVDVAVYTSKTGNLNDADNTVKWSLDENNGSAANAAVTLSPNGTTCNVAVDDSFPVDSVNLINVVATSDYDNSKQAVVPVTINKSSVSGITFTADTKTIYAATTKNSTTIKVDMNVVGAASDLINLKAVTTTNEYDDNSVTLSATQIHAGASITVTHNTAYAMTAATHGIRIRATSAYDETVTNYVDITLKREDINTFKWTAGTADIEVYEGTKLSDAIDTSKFTFEAQYSGTSRKENPIMGAGDTNVHVYIADASITEEPTTLAKVTNDTVLTMEDSGKSLVAFYKGVKATSTATTNIAIHGKINLIQNVVTVPPKYKLVTDASTLKAGDTIVFASNSKGYTAGNINSNIMGNLTTEFNTDKSEITNLGTGTIEFTLGGSDGGWSFAYGTDYLNNTAEKKVAWSTSVVKWTIALDNNNNATVKLADTSKNYGSLQYNASSPRFTTYKSSQTAIQIYRLEGGTTTATYSNVNFAVQDKVLEFVRSYKDIMNENCGVNDVSTTWGKVKTLYDTYTSQLSGDNLDLFNNILKFASAAAYDGGFTDDGRDIVQEFASSYDWMTTYYGTSEIGTDADFVGRYALAHNNASMPEIGDKTRSMGNKLFGENSLLGEATPATWIITIVAFAGLAATGGYFFIRKRKED